MVGAHCVDNSTTQSKNLERTKGDPERERPRDNLGQPQKMDRSFHPSFFPSKLADHANSLALLRERKNSSHNPISLSPSEWSPSGKRTKMQSLSAALFKSSSRAPFRFYAGVPDSIAREESRRKPARAVLLRHLLSDLPPCVMPEGYSRQTISGHLVVGHYKCLFPLDSS